jgi:hypothetical protein
MEMGHGRFIVDVLQKRGHIVGMTGNGVNDAPALAQADLGSAIGAGSDVVVETIDVMLVRSNPLDLVALLNLSKAQSCTGCNADVGEHGDSGHQCATAETDGMTKWLENGTRIAINTKQR